MAYRKVGEMTPAMQRKYLLKLGWVSNGQRGPNERWSSDRLSKRDMETHEAVAFQSELRREHFRQLGVR